ncbi:MAG TPA: hypothetical protein VFG62_07580 [Rhodopila sp.]|nr:hypothetical protein [Rhodopila sp.]
MLSIAMTVEVIKPFAVTRRRVAACVSAVMALVRFGLGVLVGVTIFAIATGIFTSACSPNAIGAPLIYGIGIFLGTTLSVPAATLSAPDRLARHLLPWISAAAILLPAGIFSQSASDGSWQHSYDIYLAATFCGGIAGTKLTLDTLARRMRIRLLT